jgi:hypothetical protein
MEDQPDSNARQQNLYLTEVLKLVVVCEYISLYHAVLARRVTWFGVLRAIASSGAIASWAITTSLPMVWGSIIAVSQVADALKDVFPFSTRHKAAGELLMSLENLRIQTLFEAEAVYAGQLAPIQITELRRKLMKSLHEAELKHFPSGRLPVRLDLKNLAERAALAYFDALFGPRTSDVKNEA